ncbi:hypothetical protein [Sphingorhabdus sp.]|uniref:hypothetical protein n=1 Tax=Sphingorhabdus sp. TaxID=1902408 RepID=UPI0032B7793E
MIDLPPEQVIEERLVECGLNPSGLTVKYEDYLQSIEINIKPEAGATPDKFGCIHKAADLEIVTFSDLEMYRKYSDFTMELYRPKMLEDARRSLEKIGKLEGFPVRSAFADDKRFAEAVEVHCGIPAGEALKEFGDGIVFMPPPEEYQDHVKFMNRYSCITSAIMFLAAKRELSIGFVGNEAVREEEQK